MRKDGTIMWKTEGEDFISSWWLMIDDDDYVRAGNIKFTKLSVAAYNIHSWSLVSNRDTETTIILKTL